MLEQFQRLLQTPKPSTESYLKMMQDKILNTMEDLMPENFDFGQLAQLFDKENEGQNLASLTYKLTQFFAEVVANHFVNLHSYLALEEQTQKLESTIRGHIKVKFPQCQMEQEMKMYLEHLEYKILRYEYHLKKLRANQSHSLQFSQELKEKDDFEQLKKKETQMLKERLILLRKVDRLQRKLKDKQLQLRRLNSPNSATIMQIKQGINRQRQIKLGKRDSQMLTGNSLHLNSISYRFSATSFTNDQQVTQKKTLIPFNSVDIHRKSITNKEQSELASIFLPAQFLDTKTS